MANKVKKSTQQRIEDRTEVQIKDNKIHRFCSKLGE